MTVETQIPVDAIEAATEAIHHADSKSDWAAASADQSARAALAVAAPLIVAAELERLADGLCCGHVLWDRAAELRAQANPPA